MRCLSKHWALCDHMSVTQPLKPVPEPSLFLPPGPSSPAWPWGLELVERASGGSKGLRLLSWWGQGWRSLVLLPLCCPSPSPLETTYFWVAVPMARPCPEGPQAAPLSRWAATSCHSLNPSACPVSSLFLCQPVLSSPFLASAPSFSKLSDQFEVSELLLSTFIRNLSSPALPRGLWG